MPEMWSSTTGYYGLLCTVCICIYGDEKEEVEECRCGAVRGI